MMKSNTAPCGDVGPVSFIGRGGESDREDSGIRASRVPVNGAVTQIVGQAADLVPEHFPTPERTTSKVPRVDLERLLAEERECAEDDEVDATMIVPPASGDRPSQERTLQLRAPLLASNMTSPLGSDFPPPVPQLTAVMTPLVPPAPAPAPAPAPLVVPTPRPRFSPPAHAMVSAPPPPVVMTPSTPARPPFEAIRAARAEARQTRYIVIAIWAFALTLAGGLGFVIATHG